MLIASIGIHLRARIPAVHLVRKRRTVSHGEHRGGGDFDVRGAIPAAHFADGAAFRPVCGASQAESNNRLSAPKSIWLLCFFFSAAQLRTVAHKRRRSVSSASSPFHIFQQRLRQKSHLHFLGRVLSVTPSPSLPPSPRLLVLSPSLTKAYLTQG